MKAHCERGNKNCTEEETLHNDETKKQKTQSNIQSPTQTLHTTADLTKDQSISTSNRPDPQYIILVLF
jgi:hypothetical protein